MANKRLIELANRQKNPSLSDKRKTSKPKPTTSTNVNTFFPDLPSGSFIFCYDGPHEGYFQELIKKNNEGFKGTAAEIPEGTTGEVTNMYILKRLGLITTIYQDFNLRSSELWPIIPSQSENLLKEGKLPKPKDYWEDLALILYDTSQNGYNPKEAQALKESIIQHRNDLGLSQPDLEEKLVVVNAGVEPDQTMPRGVKPIILPGLTQVYQHEVLGKVGEEPKFKGHGLTGGLPLLNQLGKGARTLYMPTDKSDIGLRVLIRDRNLYLVAWGRFLSGSYSDGRVNFAPQGRVSR